MRKLRLPKLTSDERAVAGTIFLVFLFGPTTPWLWIQSLVQKDLFRSFVAGGCALIFTSLVVIQLYIALSKHRAGLTLISFSAALAPFSGLMGAAGLLALITGHHPRFTYLDVPSDVAIRTIITALGLGIIAGISFIAANCKRERTGCITKR